MKGCSRVSNGFILSLGLIFKICMSKSTKFLSFSQFWPVKSNPFFSVVRRELSP
jgi:hypothetical protein